MQVATSLASVVLVSIRPVYRAGELRHALNLSGCRGLVMAPHFADSEYVRMLHEMRPRSRPHRPVEDPLPRRCRNSAQPSLHRAADARSRSENRRRGSSRTRNLRPTAGLVAVSVRAGQAAKCSHGS